MIELINIKAFNIKTVIVDIEIIESNNMNFYRICHTIYKYLIYEKDREFYLSTDIGYNKGNLIRLSISKINNENYNIRLFEPHTNNILFDIDIVNKEYLLHLMNNINGSMDTEIQSGTYKLVFEFKQIPMHYEIQEEPTGYFRKILYLDEREYYNDK